MEEVQPGEISVTDFDTPYDNGDGLWTVSNSILFHFLCSDYIPPLIFRIGTGVAVDLVVRWACVGEHQE